MTSPAPSGPIILVAEDNVEQRSLYVTILAAAGYRVLEAGDGAQAVEVARRERPNLVLMDVSMPVLDGFEATREIRAAAEDVRVLMLTGSNSRADVDRSREAGASGYITKDRIASELVAAIVEVSRRWLP